MAPLIYAGIHIRLHIIPEYVRGKSSFVSPTPRAVLSVLHLLRGAAQILAPAHSLVNWFNCLKKLRTATLLQLFPLPFLCHIKIRRREIFYTELDAHLYLKR